MHINVNDVYVFFARIKHSRAKKSWLLLWFFCIDRNGLHIRWNKNGLVEKAYDSRISIIRMRSSCIEAFGIVGIDVCALTFLRLFGLKRSVAIISSPRIVIRAPRRVHGAPHIVTHPSYPIRNTGICTIIAKKYSCAFPPIFLYGAICSNWSSLKYGLLQIAPIGWLCTIIPEVDAGG